MCGRFTFVADIKEVMDRYEIPTEYGVSSYEKRYNITPSQKVLSVINDGKKTPMRIRMKRHTF